jgi:hypothetical protein
MLTVKLERIVPDSMKPRKVAITSAKWLNTCGGNPAFWKF